MMHKSTIIHESRTILDLEPNQAVQIRLETRIMTECYDDNMPPPNAGDSPAYSVADEKPISFPHSSGALTKFNGKS